MCGDSGYDEVVWVVWLCEAIASYRGIVAASGFAEVRSEAVMADGNCLPIY